MTLTDGSVLKAAVLVYRAPVGLGEVLLMHISLMLKEMNIGLRAVAQTETLHLCSHSHIYTCKRGTTQFALLFSTIYIYLYNFVHHMVSPLLGMVCPVNASPPLPRQPTRILPLLVG